MNAACIYLIFDVQGGFCFVCVRVCGRLAEGPGRKQGVENGELRRGTR